MPRFARLIKDWTPELVSESTVAPHLYRWDVVNDDYQDAPTFKEFIAGCPYKVGDVVWLEKNGTAIRARITWVGRYYNRWGDRKEFFNVQHETKTGYWSKVWFRAYPGFIQRGYQKAGLAPEMPS